MDHFKPPSQFELTTNNAEAWETWKFKFLLYSDAIQLETKPVKQQRAILLHNIGDDALNIYKTFGLQETLTNPTITEILEKFDNHFKPFKNVIYRRYNFFSEVQEKNQSFDDFVTKVKNKAVDCDFGDLTESLIRDRIVLGVLDKNLTERYLQDPDLTLSKAIALGRAAESSRTQLKEIKEEVTVNKLSSYKETSSNKNTEHKFAKKNHKFFKACGKCASKHNYGNCPAYEPLIPHETGNYPFKKIGVDLFEIEGRKYLGIVDYYTKYPEVFELRSTKAEMVIEKLKEVFARCGVPEIMMTDNGPPFQSTEMMEFAKEWNVTHTTSSPRFPQSNGMIERTIQTLKSTIIKCQQSKQDIYQALLLLRNTEHNSLPSPAVMLYGRKQRLFLPMKTTLMNESRICEDCIRKQHEANQSRMKFYFNRHARDLPSLENGQTVLVRKEKQWSPAKVIAPGVHPRSYLLEDTKGSVLRRNRRDLRPADTLSGPTEKESPPEKQEQLDPQPSTSSQSEETLATTRTRCGRLVKPPLRQKVLGLAEVWAKFRVGLAVFVWTQTLLVFRPAISTGFSLLIDVIDQLVEGPKRQATLTNIPHSTPDQAPMDDLKLLIINLSAEVNRLGEKMDARLLNIEQKMEVWERRMAGIETSMASCTDALATNTRLISHNTLKIRNLEERVEALERRARENNLIIYGIESAETDSRELLLQKVKKLMAEDMQITDDVVIAECHRLGRGPKAPILIEVPDHESRISLLKNSFKLRMLNIFMSRDYSPQIREQRKILIEKRKELYKKGIGSKLRDNKLLLNGINYMVVEGQVMNAKGELI
ncbi:hypothetical protein LAZ67_2003696 [Cordylochernes scorpioides]|uniref:Integrase catalytic domain-containing protein n=1 Tax=Cordylochernes scorpioides TaxID=51811 RepID=A0ABY6K6F6_9ARAC|nr:hypothetical protein LAZ67_2003696 [Cordylochernes scorpioides]